ncbi:hypothetical protein ABB37_04448 [Leptomonas pyrrhocoris]|uniref:Uncharacterized protein n=1 Tax=Leptomonas pyrrhocoris TaxID=157538 RepID=A0A0M9G2H9_LEPPY|nr:hypothetical protein ABB37_04448 [Leptomonas pyrrhocoris]KPA81090.1 hypothetical protein ABB37_04448 [Leptomonas pyrrhocoris]|eukprot:XP_015659529.1 hypothetical protein ABB37_04448 [Leptomonas pyrrhocoris]
MLSRGVATALRRRALRVCDATSVAQTRTTRDGSLCFGRRSVTSTNLFVQSPSRRGSAGLRWYWGGCHAALRRNSGVQLLHTSSATAIKTASAQAPTGEHAKEDNEDASAHGTTANTGEGSKEEEAKEQSWWRRKWHSFKSEGKDFSLFYLPFYPATFVILYVAFVTNALHKESILDCVLDCMGDYVDRGKMYARIEAWNTWANLGFAFVINELLEVVRFPVVVLLYYAMKPYSTRFANWVRKVMRRFRRAKPKSAEEK